jgi:hypothetical protein
MHWTLSGAARGALAALAGSAALGVCEAAYETLSGHVLFLSNLGYGLLFFVASLVLTLIPGIVCGVILVWVGGVANV